MFGIGETLLERLACLAAAVTMRDRASGAAAVLTLVFDPVSPNRGDRHGSPLLADHRDEHRSGACAEHATSPRSDQYSESMCGDSHVTSPVAGPRSGRNRYQVRRGHRASSETMGKGAGV